MRVLEQRGYIEYTKNGVPRRKYYLDEMPGVPVQTLWLDIPPVNSQAQERISYSTQKPEALLERIISASSNPGDLVLDCFAGSGTTAAVAEKLGRRWITSDLGRFAVHTTRKRLLGIEGVKPFDVQNLGKYERQVWQAAQFGEGAQAAQEAYRAFLLNLYHATPVPGFIWLHGVKRGRMVHVGTLDSPISVGEVTQIALEWKKAIGTGENAPTSNGVDVLGWDFAFELNEVARQTAAEAGIDVKFIRIPREVMEQKAVDQGDIKFYELAALDVEAKVKGKRATLTLNNFMMSLDDVPEDVRSAVKNWSQWIDYWAVDWDNKDDAFHNMWQSYRAKKSPNIDLTTAHVYDAPGTYRVVVKVIDILGNDTTKALAVEVK
jgi:hypothetical protein